MESANETKNLIIRVYKSFKRYAKSKDFISKESKHKYKQDLRKIYQEFAENQEIQEKV